jgi:glutathione synthase/RimK-type ligase-like ATP-grasp enzyme
VKCKNILIITDDFDIHADIAILRLRELGHNPIRFNPRDTPDYSQITFDISGAACRSRLNTRNHKIYADEVDAVWWRKPKTLEKSKELSGNEATFAVTELAHALKGFWSSLDCYWMSPLANIFRAEDKVDQLKRASQMGFRIPQTLITSKPAEVMEFFDRCNGKIVYKTIADPTIAGSSSGNIVIRAGEQPPRPKYLFTTLVTREFLDENVDRVRYTPHQFQEFIPKAHELRVTVIGEEVFVAEIDSQSQGRTMVDWRHHDVPMRLRAATLPINLKEKCLKFVQGYGLNYSAMDFIITPQGEYVFLESNPNGQWYFVELQVPELRMLDQLVACLVRGRS